MRDELEAQVMAERRRVRRDVMLGETDVNRGVLEALLDVYGDRLQDAGDPRGEAIGLRHVQARPAWLGELAGHPQIEADDGFVRVRVDGSNPALLRDVLDGPGAPYLEHVWITDGPAGVRAQLELLASREHPWLGSLSITIVERDRSGPRFPSGLVERVVRATPNLEYLGMFGASYVAPFHHRALVKLAINGSANAEALTREAPLPNVVGVDLQIYPHDSLAWTSLAPLLPAANLPKLAILDLSRNHATVPAFRFLAHSATQHGLELVNLPTLRSRTDGDDLSCALTRMPGLAYLQVAGNHGDPRAFTHPTGELAIGPYRPWVPRRELQRTKLALAVGDATHELRADEAVIALERVFVDLPANVRAIWTELWTQLRATGRASLPTAALYLALAGCGDFLLDDRWRAVRRDLATVSHGDASLRWAGDP